MVLHNPTEMKGDLDQLFFLHLQLVLEQSWFHFFIFFSDKEAEYSREMVQQLIVNWASVEIISKITKDIFSFLLWN